MKYQRGNWSKANPMLGHFDLIIGSDVLYDRDQPETLSLFIEQHAASTAQVIIIDPDRGNRAKFTRKMHDYGYAHTEQSVRVLPSGVAYKGRVLNYRRQAALGVAGVALALKA